MYVICGDNGFKINNDKQGAVVKIHEPIYIENNIEKKLEFSGVENNKFIYSDSDYYVELTVDNKNNGFCIKRSWKNISGKKCKIQTVFRITPGFSVEKYLIPCINFNGNEFGNGKEPKGLEKDGEKWIFAYDRVSIPSCTITEGGDYFCALFASADTENSLQSSCSIFKENGCFYQEIYHPVIEAPQTYNLRDKYSEKYETFIELENGESFDCSFNLMVGKPKWKNYGICDVLDEALNLFGDNDYIKTPNKDELWNNSITFAKSLLTEYKGKKGFIIGFLPDGNGGFKYRKDNCFELAWCGQNVLFSRMFIEDYIKNGNKENLDIALEVLDTRVKYCIAGSGLLATQLSHFESLDSKCADTCNLGYGAYEFLRCYETLKSIGIEKEEYLNAAKGVCDFFCDNYSSEFGFGKLWTLNGRCLDKSGSIGGFVICPLVKIYNILGDKKYLNVAEKAMKFYVERDLENFCFTAGALDTYCVDKETSAPFIISAVLLYEATKDEVYLEYAQKAAYYFTSWMFHYEPIYDNDSEVKQYNVFSKGLTSVSTQHHHLDMYAALIVPYLRKLSLYTGDENWQKRSEMMWRAVLQFIGDGELKIHNVTRPVGSQNEAVLQCRWGFNEGKRGQLNDWLVAWPCAFRLSVLAEENKN